MTGKTGRALLLVLLLLPLASCASIPEYSDPKAVKPAIQDNVGSAPMAIPHGLDPLAVVRSFVDSTARPGNDYAAARAHLTPDGEKPWRPPREMLIVDDVDTLPVPPPPGAPPTTSAVTLKATKVGHLLPDQSFVPDSGEYQIQLRLQREPNGDWRIVAPPPDLLVSREAFIKNYAQVPVYFLDHDRQGVVPDLRYVVSQPSSAVPGQVIDLLLAGPSAVARDSMGTALPPDTNIRTNVSEAADGALVVNLTGLGQLPQETRRLIAAQVVLSLQTVSSNRVRLLVDGTRLLPDQEELRPADVASYEAVNAPRSDLPGLAVVDERLRTLDQKATPVPGPAGSGEYSVLNAAQSADGSQVAAVVRRPGGGVVLRIGRFGKPLAEVPLPGNFMSRPTWRSNSEVWVAVNGNSVVRVLTNGDGNWTPQQVNIGDFVRTTPITSLRLSRDGTRIAGVVGNRIVVAGVVFQDGEATLRNPMVLPGDTRFGLITGVDWLSDDELVAITDSSSVPVVGVTVNGLTWKPYVSTNLVQPLTSVTVAPGRKVVVADGSGLWQATDEQSLWQLLPVPIGSGSVPFFPG